MDIGELLEHHHIHFDTHTEDSGQSSSSFLGYMATATGSLNFSPGLAADLHFSSSQGIEFLIINICSD
jgi:hypothetical protein